MKIFVLMLLVLATVGEGKGKGKGKGSALDNFTQYNATATKDYPFLEIDATIINEETCAALCNEMQRCGVFTFRIEAEESKKESTLAGQCRFKTAEAKLGPIGKGPNKNSYVKNLEEPPELPPPEEEEPEVEWIPIWTPN